MTVFLDACAIIYWVDGVDLWYTRLTAALENLRRGAGSLHLAVSELSWLECRVKPLRDDDKVLLGRYDEFFGQPALLRVGLAASVVDVAARLRAAHKLTTPDALQAACALSLEAPVTFLTNDRRFDRVHGLKPRIL